MEDAPHTWTCIKMEDFDIPTLPASDAARGGLRRLAMSIRLAFLKPKKERASESRRGDRPSEDLLKALAPDPDWSHAARGLAEAFDEDRSSDSPASPLQALVGPPGCDVSAALKALAKQRGFRVLNAPAPESLLESQAPPAVGESAEETLVIPDLERWYLRHEDGFSTIRQLLERLLGKRQRALIGCDSWAWAFLQHALGIEDMLGEPLTFAPFDAQRLDIWFRDHLNMAENEFRQSGEGAPIFPERPPADRDKNDGASQNIEVSKTICRLAAKARGNPSVAVAFWRAAIRTLDAGSDPSESSAKSQKRAYWVVSPTKLAIPKFPPQVDQLHRFVLHSVLLHGGLSLEMLAVVMPFPRVEVQRRVRELQRTGVLEVAGGVLQVALIAYPLVRQYLQSEGFLTDAF